MLERVNDFISVQDLFDHKKSIVIGVSGGIDSMTLLHILYSLKYNIIVGHVHHNVRTESNLEYIFVKEYAEKLNIPFYGTKLPKISSGNFHDEARKLRYDFLINLAKKHDALLVTAHHLDDQLETVLLKLFRGSNLYGYAGIKTKIVLDGVEVARPLLCLSREEISTYAKNNNVPFMEDSSNNSNKYFRNRIRHNLIPILKEENTNIYEVIKSYSTQLLEAFSYIRKESLSLIENDAINISKFQESDLAIQNDAISYLLEKAHIENIKDKIPIIKRFLNGNKPNASLNIKEGLIFVREYDIARIKPKNTKVDFCIMINEFKDYLLPDNRIICLSKFFPKNGEKYLKICYNNINMPLYVRNRKNGDVLNFPYGSVKVKDYFINKKIPFALRDTIPLVLDSTTNIIGIIGFGPTKLMGESNEIAYMYIKELSNGKCDS